MSDVTSFRWLLQTKRNTTDVSSRMVNPET